MPVCLLCHMLQGLGTCLVPLFKLRPAAKEGGGGFGVSISLISDVGWRAIYAYIAWCINNSHSLAFCCTLHSSYLIVYVCSLVCLFELDEMY
jgi:hypothetical protein